jgi:transcriptional regulator GlxA family with amidase domain
MVNTLPPSSYEKSIQPKRIGVVIFDGVTLLDVAGPLDTFTAANQAAKHAHYELITLALTRDAVRAECGLMMQPQRTLARSPLLDTLIIPGGSGLRQPECLEQITKNVRRLSRTTRRIASVCTGVYALAEAGLLNGSVATTHWRFAADVAARYPAICVNAQAIFTREKNIATSAGITAGIDLCLALIEEDCGHKLALAVARELVVFMKRSGNQEQYSEPLRMQATTKGRIGELISWISANLASDLRVTALASRVSLSERQLSRLIKNQLHVRVSELVQNLRLAEAKRRLVASDEPIEAVARAVGYASDDAFRRAFQRQFAAAPKQFRERFSSTERPSSRQSIAGKHTESQK